MEAKEPTKQVYQRLHINREISLKDWSIMAAVTLVSLPIGFYFGRGNGKFVQRATMYTTGLLGLGGGYAIALTNTKKRVLGN